MILSLFEIFARSFRKKPPLIPEPGQKVLLLSEDGTWCGGYRAVSEPDTSETGEVVLRVAEEREFREAQWEDRLAEGEPWPAERIKVSRAQQRQARRRLQRHPGGGAR